MFNFILFVSMLSPGPAQLVAIQTTLSSGVKAGRWVGLGLGLIASTWTLCGFLGLEVVFAVFPKAYLIVKVAGALYLLYLAWGMWRGAGGPIQIRDGSKHSAFVRGVTVNLLNPKSVLFAASVIAVVFPSPVDIGFAIGLSLNHLLMEILFYTLLAHTMSRDTVRAAYDRLKAHFDRVAAAALGFFGTRLLWSLRD